MEHLSYPNESPEYRQARNALLKAEMDLRTQAEAVAAQRRALPSGGEVPEDYCFERIGENGMPEKVRMSALFGRHDTLILYSFMYGPEKKRPCSSCVNLMDGVDGIAPHVEQRAALYIVAKSPVARLEAWARERGWRHLRFLSTAGNTYVADYFGDTSKLPSSIRKAQGIADGEDWDQTIYTVFRLEDGKARLFWGSELTWAPTAPNQDHRSGDFTSPLWGLLDMTPEGRGKFFPELKYE